MPSYTFDRLEDARDIRARVSEYLSRTDDGRTATVRLQASTPDRIKNRVEEAALRSRRQQSQSAGQADLTAREKKSLKRQHRTFNSGADVLEARRVKAATKAQGATEWMDFYEPGEGIEGALANLRSSKGSAQRTGAGTGLGGKRMDIETDRGRQARQAERASSQRAQSAKEPAILAQDPDAIDFLEEEQRFDDDVFDIGFSRTDSFGRPEPTGADADLLRKANQQRGSRAVDVDDQQQAPITRDPLEWTQNKNTLDFPGIDTVKPEKVHDARSKRSRAIDEAKQADIADSVEEWFSDPSATDLPGIDAPGVRDSDGLDMDLDGIDNDLGGL